MAILGPSGAGKTTLLNTLNFRQGSNMYVTGSRLLNGVSITNRNHLQKCAYVEQCDIFLSYLTVKEHLIFQVP